jgi:DNA-binding response OmpR family regulator
MSTTVLVVEDDLEINELLGEYLSLENIKYLQATTGHSGIHQAASTHPDAMILDLMLPDINGFEVAKSLTMKRATFDIPIVILSCMCQECDKLRGFAAGALYYMNKPFLPDDLLSTLRMALDWKNSLRTRKPEGTITLGDKETACARGINEMVADIFVQTELSDAAVGQIREAVETLADWAVQWNKENRSQTVVKVDYRIARGEGNGTGGTGPTIEWTISENVPGMLADAFFKPVIQASGTGIGGGLLGWGAGSLLTKPIAPIAPPSKWLQVLAKTGAAKFEKDSKTKTVRFARNGSAAVSSSEAVVPVVEIDGNRFPTRLRDEALAAKRK